MVDRDSTDAPAESQEPEFDVSLILRVVSAAEPATDGPTAQRLRRLLERAVPVAVTEYHRALSARQLSLGALVGLGCEHAQTLAANQHAIFERGRLDDPGSAAVAFLALAKVLAILSIASPTGAHFLGLAWLSPWSASRETRLA